MNKYEKGLWRGALKDLGFIIGGGLCLSAIGFIIDILYSMFIR